MDIFSCAGEKIFDPQKSSSLIGFFDLDYLQSWGHSQRFWSVRPLLGPAAFQEWVALMLIRKHHSVLCSPSQKFLSIQKWCWLGLLLLRVYRMGWAFQSFLECNFCNNSRSPDIAAKLFLIWGISVYLKSFASCEFVAIHPRMKWFLQEIQLAWLQSGTF